jgi:CubicO group peptidase (beta-lactamase class C family)
VPVIGGADGGAFSSTGDLDRFLRRIADATLLGPMQDVVLAATPTPAKSFHSGYGFRHYPDGRFGNGGGDPGVEVLLHRFPDDDVNVVALRNMEGLAGEVRDVVVEAWPRSDHPSS